ncbi:MAG: TIGR03013 family XrtA/PEP-CTERM system glycosyltransferase [Pseudomonadota bacterium]
MAGHIRLFRHYIHTSFLIATLAEGLAVVAAAYTGHFTRWGEFPDFYTHLPFALTLAAVLTFSMAIMGVHEARLREGYVGVMLRTAVAMFLLGTLAMAVVMYLATGLSEGRGVLLFSTIEAFIFVAVLRWFTSRFLSEDLLKRRVLVYGTGHRASKIASRMRRRSDRRAFVLVGYLQPDSSEDLVSEYGATILPKPNVTLSEYCEDLDIDEIVIAFDARRESDQGAGVPFEELMECRLNGIEVCEVQSFVEREAGKLDVDLLQRSWLVYSDGFVTGWLRAGTKRTFDLLAASALLLTLWPVMLLAALAILIGDKFRGPVLYRQDRIGLNGERFKVIKFRTMIVDAEKSGAVWASHDDPRVTRVGAFLRKSRLDELPQLFSVLRGTMSMVGPRPERPMFVDNLEGQLPFYQQRHRIKPGITGWAQLCHPYGGSVQDSKEKLQYDLYYLKNHSILLDLIILMQTIEVVLVGDGAR